MKRRRRRRRITDKAQLKTWIWRNLVATSVLGVADAAHVQLFLLLHEAALQPVHPPLSPPAPPSPLQSAPGHLQQEEASECEAGIEDDDGEIIHLSNKVNNE